MFFKHFSWLIVLALILTFYVWQQTLADRLAYKVENLEKESEKIEQENDNLRLKIHRLLSLERLNQVAKEKKLVSPDKNKCIFLQ
jgi:cell division protein FtsL